MSEEELASGKGFTLTLQVWKTEAALVDLGLVPAGQAAVPASPQHEKGELSRIPLQQLSAYDSCKSCTPTASAEPVANQHMVEQQQLANRISARHGLCFCSRSPLASAPEKLQQVAVARLNSAPPELLSPLRHPRAAPTPAEGGQ